MDQVHHQDLIIVLDDGKVNGIGTHSELLKTNAIYKEINDIAIDKGIKIYPYDSYTMKQNKIDKQKEDGIL